jgi:hypothetical protein
MAEQQLPDKSETVELFELHWLPDAPNGYKNPQALERLRLSDNDLELLQMGLVSLIKGNFTLAAARMEDAPRIQIDETTMVDVGSILEGTAGEAQELLNRLIMLVDRNLAELGW